MYRYTLFCCCFKIIIELKHKEI